ncbi:MAG TPA: hypothetical protein DDW42_03955 [Desulfobacteraceae bacterium]|nr:hypothetical protein [Desulfobacteraceae bacterium]
MIDEDMRPQIRKTNKGPKRYHVDLSLMSILFWSSGLFFLLGWIFVLGILVGRGFFPDGMKNLSELKNQIAKLQDMVSSNDSTDIKINKKPEKNSEFAFYDELSAKKGKAAKKRTPSAKKTVHKISDKKKNTHISPTKKGAKYTVQLCSLNSEINALKMVNRLIDQGYPAYYLKSNTKGKTHFRVRCGPFKNKKEASDIKWRLAKKEKLKGFVTSLEK